MKSSSWGRNIVVVYAVFALSTLAFVGFAMTQRVDLTSADYYEQALEYDATAMARQRGRASGAVITVDDSLRITFPGDHHVSGNLEVQFTRADNPALDRTYRLPVPRSNVVAIPYKSFTAGVWMVRLSWMQQSHRCQIESRIRIGDR
jgi:hypothetical protein